MKEMMVVTIPNIPGQDLEVLGLVKGSTVQSKNAVRDLTSSLKTFVGGELKAYTEMLNEAREVAMRRMIAEAKSLGADAVVGFHLQSSSATSGSSEIVAYGTAVKFTL